MKNHTVTYRSSAIRIALDSSEKATAKVRAMWTRTVDLNKAMEPMHCPRTRYQEQPKWVHSETHTLVGYWELNGVKAHCLLDSESKGILLSP